MKTKNFFLIVIILIATITLSLFLFDLLNNQNSEVLVNLTNQDNLVNNVYVRDDSSVNNTTTNSNSTTSINSNKALKKLLIGLFLIIHTFKFLNLTKINKITLNINVLDKISYK